VAERVAGALLRSGVPTGVWQPGRSVDAMSGDVPSCIIQGAAISALVRIARTHPDVVPDAVLERAVKALVSPALEGGTATQTLGGPFLEEFDSLSHVLNGCVYALWALYDLVDGRGCSDLKPLVEAVEASLARLAPRFTMANGWSLYALDTYGYAPLASILYHRSHIRMFRVLSERTGHAAYAQAAERWTAAPARPSAPFSPGKCTQVVWMRDVRRLALASNIWRCLLSLAMAVALLDSAVPPWITAALAPPRGQAVLVQHALAAAGVFEPDERKCLRLGMMVFQALLFDDARGLTASLAGAHRDDL
jgi:hypothetical protein